MTKYFKVSEVAEILRVKETTVREWLKKGKMPGEKRGKHWLIPDGAVYNKVVR